MNKVTIIGAGSVGSTIAYTLAVAGLASEIVLIDINEKKAFGEAMDIRQGTPFCSPCFIYSGGYEDAKNSDIVIVTSGIARKAGQSRLDLAQINVNITKQIIPEITAAAPDATYIIVSNPVDILTYTFCKCSDIPETRIIGTGTLLDTTRLRARLSEIYSINQQNVHAFVLGEHGDSSFVPWSTLNISNVPVDRYNAAITRGEETFDKLDYAEVEDYIRKSGGMVIASKGATFYAISICVSHLCRCLFSGIDTTLAVSTMLHGEYGVDDVCLSIPTIIGHGGVHGKMLMPLTDEEVAKLHKSAESLKAIIRSVDI